MTTRNEDAYHASDYAGLVGGKYRFYYGYEETNEDDEWLFRAWQGDTLTMSYTAEQLGMKQFDSPRDVLMRGIARYFSLASS